MILCWFLCFILPFVFLRWILVASFPRPSFSPCAFRFSAVQVYRLCWTSFSSFSCFFRCALPVGVFSFIFFNFLRFGCPGGGPGGAFFSLGSSSSAKAGTFDFERQYNVLGVFSTFGGFQKQRKSNKKVLEKLLFSELRKNRSGTDFPGFWAPFWTPLSIPGVKKWSWKGSFLLKRVLEARRERFRLIFCAFGLPFGSLLLVCLAPVW